VTHHTPKSGTDWHPKVTPSSPLDPKYFYGCKTVMELSEHYRKGKQRGFSVQDMVAAVVESNDGFCDYPIPSADWPKVQLAILMLGIDEFGWQTLKARKMFQTNRGN